MFWKSLFITLVGFLSGSVLYSFYIPKWFFGVDTRLAGSDRNPGGTNAARALGPKIGGLCMALDVFKAFLPVFAGVVFLGLRGGPLIPILLAPVCGHLFPPLMRFHGGKGVAATFGALLGVITLSRSVFILAVALAALTFIFVIKPDSARVMAGAVLSFGAALVLEPMLPVKAAFCLLMCLLFWRHLRHPDAGPLTVGTRHVRYEVGLTGHWLHFSRV